MFVFSLFILKGLCMFGCQFFITCVMQRFFSHSVAYHSLNNVFHSTKVFNFAISNLADFFLSFFFLQGVHFIELVSSQCTGKPWLPPHLSLLLGDQKAFIHLKLRTKRVAIMADHLKLEEQVLRWRFKNLDYIIHTKDFFSM